MSNPTDALLLRAGHKCELCESTDDLAPYNVPSKQHRADSDVLLCAACRSQVEPGTALDPNRWFGLQGSVWSEHPAVQVLSWRLVERLAATEAWAADLLDQVYLDGELDTWARETDESEQVFETPTVDSAGATLLRGDTIQLIKDLDVKGAAFTAKRGTKVKGIRLSSDPGYIEARINGMAIMLKTEFVKKVPA